MLESALLSPCIQYPSIAAADKKKSSFAPPNPLPALRRRGRFRVIHPLQLPLTVLHQPPSPTSQARDAFNHHPLESIRLHPSLHRGIPYARPLIRFQWPSKLTRAPGNGEFLVVLDDPSRENEADLIIAAEDITTAKMGFLVRHSSGLICAPLSPALTESLNLPQMVAKNEDFRGTAYTLSVDSADPTVSTGISARDRALTVRTLADPAATPASFRRPGHVFPLKSRPGGVRQRPGHTEAATEFCRLAGKVQAAAICEIVDDGEEVEGQALREGTGMLRGEACIAFARKWGLNVCTIADLVAYVEKTEGKLEANGS